MALLDARYTASEINGLDCGVFMGALSGSSTIGRQPTLAEDAGKVSVYSATGAALSIASGRISYVFNFQGPNSVYDTACSSSLVALDTAISALREGKCEMALVAGANELFEKDVFQAFARAGMLSPTGRCHTFDASADGYLRGEGCGAILLKRSSKVEQNSAYANILGASVMSDGTSASITAPNGSAQERLIKRALEASGIKPNDVDYIEAHGTGTVLGDPIELEALAEVFAESRLGSHPLMIGSVKSNIGHLEGAAGIAGLIKAILVLAHECVPPNAALRTLNPLIEKTIQSHGFAVKFPTEVEPVVKSEVKDEKLLVAGVSSFGYSGTIAHAIIQQAPLNIRRSINQVSNDSLAKKEPGVGFLFTGQGSQYAGMGKALYSENKAFRQAMDQCNSIYKSLTNEESLLDTIFNNDAGESSITRIAQPALVALEWSLGQMWQTHGVAPSIVLGHSVGEVS